MRRWSRAGFEPVEQLIQSNDEGDDVRLSRCRSCKTSPLNECAVGNLLIVTDDRQTAPSAHPSPNLLLLKKTRVDRGAGLMYKKIKICKFKFICIKERLT